jgi:hypothetical protein
MAVVTTIFIVYQRKKYKDLLIIILHTLGYTSCVAIIPFSVWLISTCLKQDCKLHKEIFRNYVFKLQIYCVLHSIFRVLKSMANKKNFDLKFYYTFYILFNCICSSTKKNSQIY